MRLVIFGAGGRTGAQLVAQALERGDEVTAVVRRPTGMPGGVAERIVPDLADTAAVREVIANGDAVLSAIGPRSRADAPAAAPATRHILAAAPRRIVVISAAPVGAPAADDSFISRRIALPIVGRVLRPVYDDLRQMEEALAASDAVWTALRPPMLTNGPATGRYRTVVGGAVPRGFTVSRADLAAAMLEALDRPDTANRPVGVAR
ncbi:NAD(P)-dependent oxidoreductase [Leifsonia sp. LS-T14]|uniref:NAD(P)-dependent oxidoreductase n=1 Tax=unclassified Leifsonia TaxID=2663824 RepID=UPI0035A5D58C